METIKHLAFIIAFLYFASFIPVRAQQDCSEFWICTDWSFCLGSGVQMRECKDVNRCGTENTRPAETQACAPMATKEIVLPEKETGGVTGTLISNTPAVLGLIVLALLGAVYIAYRKIKDIRLFVSSP